MDILQAIFSIIIFIALFSPFYLLFYWLYKMKKKREKNDEIAAQNFRELEGVKVNTNQQVKKVVLQSSILKHRFITNDAGESHREYFPVFLQLTDAELYLGLHYYREVQKGGGSGGQYSDLLYRYAFWVIPAELPDFELNNTLFGRKKVDKLHFDTATEEALFRKLWGFVAHHKFKAIQVMDGYALLVRPLPKNWKILGESPISISLLKQYTEELKAFIV